ncbi:MAG: pyridoxal-phosphate dependent enzyme, partial [Burkholderiaceae bacterium]
AATRGYGAEVITFDRFREDRDALSRKLAEERGMTLIPPFDHADVIAGQGTAGKELLEEVGELDYFFVCLGGGGLIGGCSLAARALSPACKVYGVEPEAGNDAQQSFRQGERVKIDVPRTIADGAQTQMVGALNWALIQDNVDDVFTAADAQLVDCMKFYAERMKMIVEPTGCLSFAGARHSGVDLKGARVGVLISGGNVDLARFAELTA